MPVDSRPLTSPPLRHHETTASSARAATEEPPDGQAHLTGFDSLAGAVTVITSADGAGARFGVTCTSVCALSMDPPTLVACIPRKSTLGRDVGRTGQFCVNVLNAGQRAIAEEFEVARGAGGGRFEHGHWISGATGSPVLQDALASLECTVELMYGYPEHLMVAGSVQNVAQAARSGEPLVHVARQYAQLDHDNVLAAAGA